MGKAVAPPAPKAALSPPQQPLAVQPNQFELYQRNTREGLQSFLIKVLDQCQQGVSVLHHVGAIPRIPISNKFPFYKEAVAHPEVATKLSGKQARAIALHDLLSSPGAAPPDTSAIRPRPKHARDAFGPGMVVVVNGVLTWLLFSIDVRNSMLK